MLVVGVFAGAVTGIVGSGASILMLPILVWQYGPKQAVPIMAIAGLLSNLGKITAWWRDVDWRVFAAYSLTAVPAAAVGARTLLVLPPAVVETALGVFFLLMIPTRRWMRRRAYRMPLWGLALTGAVTGFLSGIVLSTGPLTIPAFAAAGLLKGALLSTEAMASLAQMVSKIVTFREMGALPTEIIVQGAIVGAAVMAGTYVGKWIVVRMSLRTFEFLLDGLLVFSGLSLLWLALSGAGAQ